MGESPHSKVPCVECHIGRGAKWYVKAKLSGLRQVYAVLTNSYERPIPEPVLNLRPARETCEKCHWPKKFYSGRQKVFYHFAADETNTPCEINLLIGIGGTPKDANATGIHWHINSEVYYYARDEKRQDLPYVVVKRKDGSVEDFITTKNPPTAQELSKMDRRRMDCIDCHNRPAHIFKAPGQEMDESVVSGKIDRGLPYIKKISVELLMATYTTKADGYAAIAKTIPAFYEKNYPQIVKTKSDQINEAVEVVKDIFRRNVFPSMKVSWNTYVNNIGHFYSPGCFRCHDGKHVSKQTGKPIPRDCTLCHTFLNEKLEAVKEVPKPVNFVHPIDIGGDAFVKASTCGDCHTQGGLDVTGGETKHQ